MRQSAQLTDPARPSEFHLPASQVIAWTIYPVVAVFLAAATMTNTHAARAVAQAAQSYGPPMMEQLAFLF